LGNGLNGVYIENAPLNTIGLNLPGAGNVISCNGQNGIEIFADDPRPEATGTNLILNNFIGTNGTATLNLGNASNGVLMSGVTRFNTIGGPGILDFNVIAFNGQAGVIRPGTPEANGILGNRIFSNGLLGIDVVGDGVTFNNGGAEDDIINFPVLEAVFTDGNQTFITGRLQSHPDEVYLLVFFANDSCDPSQHGEGQIPLGSAPFNTDSNGVLRFTARVQAVLAPIGAIITVTASRRHILPIFNVFWETSEFSRCATVIVAIPGDVDGNGCVDDADLAAIVFEFGGSESGAFGNTDLNDDGIVDDADLAEVIFNFGNGC
jgi:hypothetical protein